MEINFKKVLEAIELIEKVNKMPILDLAKELEQTYDLDLTSNNERVSLWEDDEGKKELTTDSIVDEYMYTGLNNIDFLKLLKSLEIWK